MKNYEVTFIVDPVLSSDEIKSAAQQYQDLLKEGGCEIVATSELGLKPLAYEIKKRSSGIYFVIEFNAETGLIIDKMELALRRDERIMRFLTVHLDKYGVKYNADKRAGKIASMKDRKAKETAESTAKEEAPVRKSTSRSKDLSAGGVNAPVVESPVVEPQPEAQVETKSEEE
jgi:small subunit ribosomal protein S6